MTPTEEPVDHSIVAAPGNVLSRPVQFAEYKRLSWTAVPGFFDWKLPPLNDGPKKASQADGLDIDEDEAEDGAEGGNSKPKDSDKELVPVTNKWIYAFETGSEDKPKLPILAREYHSDENGKLTFVDGATRRLVEADDKSGPIGQPTPDAALPHARQREHLHYVFVATRGRLCKDAIWDIERSLTGPPSSWRMRSIYKPVNLGDSLPSAGSNGQWFAPVVDPLTFAENLGRSYRRALNWLINLSVPHQDNPKREEVSLSARKYHLASMIQGTLLRDGDPFDIKPHLTNNGDLMSHFMAKHQAAMSDARKQIQIQAAALIVFLKSGIWSHARGWYLGPGKPGPTTVAAQNVGHFFLESEAKTLRRLSETAAGKRYLHELAQEPHGPPTWVFEPPEHEHKARELYEKWYPVSRKTITAIIFGIAEFAPQMSVTGKISHTNALVRGTLKHIFPLASQAALQGKHKKLLTHLLKLSPEGRGVQLAYDKLEDELKHWIHDNKAIWPHGSKFAKPAELLSHVLAAVELINLGDKLHHMMEEYSKQDRSERESAAVVKAKIVIAGLDLLVAAEEPIREYGLHLVETEEGKEIVEKVLSPAKFKFLGFVSGLVEGYVAILEAREAAEHGESGVSAGYGIVAGGAFLSAAGFGLGVISKSVATSVLTAASLSLVVTGIAIVALGYVVVACLKTTPWQSFAGHSVFGIDKSDGKTMWSGTEFSEWKETPEGLDIQIRVLTAMLCGFTIAGEGSKSMGSSVRLALGRLPPNAKLQIQFELTLDNDATMSPGYLIDLEKRTLIHTWGGVSDCRQLDFGGGDEITSVVVAPSWPAGHAVTRSHCFALIQYAPQVTDGATGIATGTIPVGGALRYDIVEDGLIGIAHTNKLESIEAKT